MRMKNSACFTFSLYNWMLCIFVSSKYIKKIGRQNLFLDQILNFHLLFAQGFYSYGLQLKLSSDEGVDQH